MYRRFLSALPIVLLCTCSGCLFNCHTTGLIRESEPRQSVVFESAMAQQAFNARAMSEDVSGETLKSCGVAIPFLLSCSRQKKLAPAASYNDQVVLCDTDGDRHITDAEAMTYNPEFHWSHVDGSGIDGPGFQIVEPD